MRPRHPPSPFRAPRTPCQHGAGQPLGADQVREALAFAEAHCARRAGRLTDWRREVLRALLSAGRPAKAYDLAAEVVLNDHPSPPSVYRALAALQELGLVHKFECEDAYFAVPSLYVGIPIAVMVCECCGDTALSADCHREIKLAIATAGFDIHGLSVEAIGRCKTCETAEIGSPADGARAAATGEHRHDA